MSEPRPRVLVVEDDETSALLTEHILTSSGFDVQTVNDGEDAVALVRTDPIDVVILDFELPGISGQETCRRIRAFSDVYIIMVTARTDEVDKVLTISLGADDYLTKPYSPQELVVRARALLRRPRSSPPIDVRDVDGKSSMPRELRVRVDDRLREVFVGDVAIKATQIEYRIVCVLLAASPDARSRNDLLAEVWEEGGGGNTHMVDVHLSNLRRKLRSAGAPEVIQNVRNVGFRMIPDVVS